MTQNVKADAPIRVDIRVEHFGQELDLGCLVRVLLSKLDCQIKTATFPDGVIRSKNYSFPVEERVA